MDFFRIDHRESSFSELKWIIFAVVTGLIFISFFLQMSIGQCPVP